MKEAKYDNYGGIVDAVDKKNENISVGTKKKKYNVLEKFIIKHVKRVNAVLDKAGRYNCRKANSPRVIRIGPTNRCTARCSYCPREHIHDSGSGYMEFELYERIVKWARENKVDTISFGLFGEAFLHPRLIDMIDLAVKSNIKVKVSTNAIVLNKKRVDQLLEYPILSVEMSMDGFNRQEYKEGKQVDKFDEAKSNILYLLKRAKELKKDTLFNIHFVDVGNVSFANRIKYIKYWKKQLEGLNKAASFSYEPHNWAGARDGLRKKMSWVNRLLAKFELKKPCTYLNGLNVNWNGDVYICCNNPVKEAIIGNITNEEILSVYNNSKRINYLDCHEKGDFRELDCGRCTVNSILPFVFIKKRITNSIISFLSS